MKGFILGIIITCAVAAVATYVYFSQGFAPVATSAQAMPFEKRLARIALKAHLNKEAANHPPIAADESNLIAAVGTYKQNCAMCHGLPNEPPALFANGMFPKPPQLFRGRGVTNDPQGRTYWKIANGIRLSGMPSFKPALSEIDIWQVTLLLANADKLPQSVQARLGGGLQPNAPLGEHKH